MPLSIKVPGENRHSIVRIPIDFCGDNLTIRCTYVTGADSPEIRAVHYALTALAAYVRETADEGCFCITLPVYIFTRCDELQFSETSDPRTLTAGRALYLVICRVHIWERLGLTLSQMAAIFLEELLHCAYCIQDETEVKHKVVEILQHSDPSINFASFYGSMPGKINFT